ncbi:hypothetical protein SPAB_01129 [Salmonella enterica subsp. enterica serovar Paratyphi B str. SPB7]|uniref:Uncharacterized protein n=1 Tax=Salmonella paratyphi B (strain ATCC BAA-1250 / SPB7) TaxID=1016998 RepID=A0A6C6YZQ7_SALPB|nr:hypothetical protein SPAB_01129 [Salmonella enterica subsp. enterica serovar Paratyphi B str. SPB7]
MLFTEIPECVFIFEVMTHESFIPSLHNPLYSFTSI